MLELALLSLLLVELGYGHVMVVTDEEIITVPL